MRSEEKEEEGEEGEEDEGERKREGRRGTNDGREAEEQEQEEDALRSTEQPCARRVSMRLPGSFSLFPLLSLLLTRVHTCNGRALLQPQHARVYNAP